jgi:hypothetical protein
LYKKHCQRNPYIIEFKVIFNACNIGHIYIIEFYFIYLNVISLFLFEELVELGLKKLKKVTMENLLKLAEVDPVPPYFLVAF